MDEEQAKKELLKVKGCYERVFSTPDGKVVFDDLMKFGGTSYSPFHVDSNTMAFKCGIQEFALRLKKMVEPTGEFKKNEVIT